MSYVFSNHSYWQYCSFLIPLSVLPLSKNNSCKVCSSLLWTPFVFVLKGKDPLKLSLLCSLNGSLWFEVFPCISYSFPLAFLFVAVTLCKETSRCLILSLPVLEESTSESFPYVRPVLRRVAQTDCHVEARVPSWKVSVGLLQPGPKATAHLWQCRHLILAIKSLPSRPLALLSSLICIHHPDTLSYSSSKGRCFCFPWIPSDCVFAFSSSHCAVAVMLSPNSSNELKCPKSSLMPLLQIPSPFVDIS